MFRMIIPCNIRFFIQNKATHELCSTFIIKGLFPPNNNNNNSKRFKYFFSLSRENKNIIMCLMIGLKQWPYGQLENFACVLHYYTQEWKPFSMGKFPTTLCALIYTLKLLKISASQKWKICSLIQCWHWTYHK